MIQAPPVQTIIQHHLAVIITTPLPLPALRPITTIQRLQVHQVITTIQRHLPVQVIDDNDIFFSF